MMGHDEPMGVGIVQRAPDWARAAAAAAAALTPGTGRSATEPARRSAAEAWIALSADGRMRDSPPEWNLRVYVQTLNAVFFCIELNSLSDREYWLDIARRLADQLEALATDLDGPTVARAWLSLAIHLDQMVELSATGDVAGTLHRAMAAAQRAVATADADTGLEGRARRHHTVAVIARRLATAGQGALWWDQSVASDRIAVGLDPHTDDLPAAAEVVDNAVGPAVENSVRWQGLSIAYRQRGVAFGSSDDLTRALEAAGVALAFAPLGSPLRGAPLMALGGALVSLADHVDDPVGHVREAVNAYRMAVELPQAGAVRRQKRATSLGGALRRLHELTRDQDPTPPAGLLEEAIEVTVLAVRLTAPGARERPRLVANLANAIKTRADELDDHRELERAVRWYRIAFRQTVALGESSVRDQLVVQLDLANALERARRTATTGLDPEAEALFTGALLRSTELETNLFVRASRTLAFALMRAQRPNDAAKVVADAVGSLGGSVDPRVHASVAQLRSEAANLFIRGKRLAAALSMVDVAQDARITMFLPSAAGGRILVNDSHIGWQSEDRPALTWARLRAQRDRLQRRYRSGDSDRPSDEDVVAALEYCTEMLGDLAPSSAVAEGPLMVVAGDPVVDLPITSLLDDGRGVVVRNLNRGTVFCDSPIASYRSTLAVVFGQHPELTGATVEYAAMSRRFGDLRTAMAPGFIGRTLAVLHIAAHGGELDGQPAVEVAPGEWLTADTLAESDAIPPVVVLTVCPTAYRNDAPYPPFRLPDALLSMGAHVVVGPLWPIRDAAAAAFSAAFYSNLDLSLMKKHPARSIAATVARVSRELRSLTVTELAEKYPDLSVLQDLRRDGAARPFGDVRDHAGWVCWI